MTSPSTHVIVWTALPNGVNGTPTGERARLSVFVTPRLQPGQSGGSLGDFADWPACLQPDRVSFAVEVPGAAAPVTAARVGQQPDSALWSAIFAHSSLVVSPAAGPDANVPRTYISYPVRTLHARLKQAHQQLAADRSALHTDAAGVQAAFADVVAAVAPTADPGARSDEQLAAALSSLDSEGDPGRLRDLHVELARGLLSQSAADITRRIADATAVADRQAALDPGQPVPVVPADPYVQLVAFHLGPVFQATAPLAKRPHFDFHQILTFLADYPELMRRLGLVIDLDVPAQALPSSPGGSTQPQRLRIVPTFTPPLGAEFQRPFTAYVLDGHDGGRLFDAAPALRPATPPGPAPPGAGTPAPAPTEIVHGLLNLRLDAAFEAIHLDVDGGALKTVLMATSQAAPAAVPTLRSSGVTIARDGHAEVLMNRIAAGQTNRDRLTANQEVTLFADDLVRGYRFDAHDGRDWRSLHRRVGTYALTREGGPAPLTFEDEGTVQPAATRRPGGPDGSEPDPASPFFIHESLLHWQGWSLAAPRPGKTVGADGATDVTSKPLPETPPLSVTFTAAPRTLPTLRFGRKYRFRARTVDLAGNSLTLDEATRVLDLLRANAQVALPVLPADDAWFTYRRYEPIVSPVLVLREKLGPGEALERLVIRSRPGVTAADYALAIDTQLMTDTYHATCERHVAPPRTSQSTAETHGAFDASFGTGTGFSQTYRVAVKEKGSLSDPFVIDTTTGHPVPIPDTTDADPRTGAPRTRPSVEVVVTGATASGDRGYAVHHEAQLVLPYLPDPPSRGAALFGLPGVAAGDAGRLDPNGSLVFARSTLAPDTLTVLGGSTLHIDFSGSWPLLRPFRIQLADPGPGGSAPQPAWDPPTRVLTVFLPQAERATFRLSSFLSADEDGGRLDELGLWPWVEELVPPQDPRHDNAMRTALQGGHPMISPFRTIELVHAVEAPLRPPTLDEQELRTPRPVGATYANVGGMARIHGKSTAKIDLLATWTEYVDADPGPDHPAGPVTTERSAHVFEVPIVLPGESGGEQSDPGSVPIATYEPEPQDSITFHAPPTGSQPGPTYLSRHEFGDTMHRLVSYQLVATSRFGEYFPPEVTADPQNISVSGNQVPIHVPSSARPAAPVVESVLPTFRWRREPGSNGGRVSERTGGIRVYLDRPWYSSGDGEFLGVVLTDSAPPPPAVVPYVTHWGRNAIFGSGRLTSALQVDSFPSRVVIPDAPDHGLRIDELAGLAGSPAVSVAAHAVFFDADRQLWYSDIEIEGAPQQTYFPNVRLALARYQPYSLPGLELSRVVLTDFVQVAPPRRVEVTADPDHPDVFGVLVTGITYDSSSWDPDPLVRYTHPITAVPHGGWEQPPTELELVPGLIEVTVERRIPGTAGDLGWTQVVDGGVTVHADAATMVGTSLGSPVPPLWRGQVTLPAGRTPGDFRLVIREREHLTTDAVDVLTRKIKGLPDAGYDTPEGHVGPVVHYPPGTVGYEVEYVFAPGQGRLVFAETILL